MFVVFVLGRVLTKWTYLSSIRLFMTALGPRRSIHLVLSRWTVTPPVWVKFRPRPSFINCITGHVLWGQWRRRHLSDLLEERPLIMTTLVILPLLEQDEEDEVLLFRTILKVWSIEWTYRLRQHPMPQSITTIESPKIHSNDQAPIIKSLFTSFFYRPF